MSKTTGTHTVRASGKSEEKAKAALKTQITGWVNNMKKDYNNFQYSPTSEIEITEPQPDAASQAWGQADPTAGAVMLKSNQLHPTLEAGSIGLL